MIKSQEGDHLCVLVHGLWGTPAHLKELATGLRKKHDSKSFHILVVNTNSQYLTYDGIDLGGERVAKEVEAELARLEKQGGKVTKLSFVGYSLGGLIARYCIGLLYSRGWFDKLTPVNFTAFASPFLGVRAPIRSYGTRFWNALGGRTLATSGQQLFLLDKFRDTERPLLSILTDPDAIFIKALSLFKNKVLYANVVNDRSAPYYTTCISSSDPYEDPNLVDLHPLEGYGPTILDPNNPVTPKSQEELGPLTRFMARSSTFFSNLPVMALIGFVAPVAVIGFLANSGYQTLQSMKRMRLHYEDSSLGFSTYRTPLLLESAVKDINNNLPTQKLNSHAKSASTGYGSSEASGPTQGSVSESVNEKDPFPTLALAPEQFEMIKNLNALGWRKYGVHITKVRHSHAAIILRIDKPGYQEGRVVIKHWVEQEFEA